MTREGSTVEAALILTGLGIVTIGCGVLTRFPRIYNFPVILTEHNVQRQYKNGVQLMAWATACLAGTMVVTVANWLWGLGVGLTWLPSAAGICVLIVFIWRMVKLR